MFFFLPNFIILDDNIDIEIIIQVCESIQYHIEGRQDDELKKIITQLKSEPIFDNLYNRCHDNPDHGDDPIKIDTDKCKETVLYLLCRGKDWITFGNAINAYDLVVNQNLYNQIKLALNKELGQSDEPDYHIKITNLAQKIRRDLQMNIWKNDLEKISNQVNEQEPSDNIEDMFRQYRQNLSTNIGQREKYQDVLLTILLYTNNIIQFSQ